MAPVASIVLDNRSVRDDNDVLQGHFARIDVGEHEGEIGVFTDVITTDRDGYPDAVHVELRNTGEIVVVDHADLTPVAFGGR